MKIVEVVAGVFIENKKLFISQRSEGNYKGYWEFPGGKIEENESHSQTLIREIREELGAEIKVKDYFEIIDYDYPNFHLTMYLYLAEFITEPKLIEHLDFKWITKNDMDNIKWLPADISVISKLKKIL